MIDQENRELYLRHKHRMGGGGFETGDWFRTIVWRADTQRLEVTCTEKSTERTASSSVRLYTRGQFARLFSRVGLELEAVFGIPASEARVVCSPLRVCPLGAHIDHQLGPVTGTAIDRSILLAFAPSEGPDVRLQATDFEGEVRFSVEDIPLGGRAG